MKKLLTLALAAVLALSLVACGGSGSIKDGTYTAQYKEPSHDWTEYLSVTYKDGVITDVDFDAKERSHGRDLPDGSASFRVDSPA